MKRTIEIECPDGYKPIYNAITGNVKIVPENTMDISLEMRLAIMNP